MATPPPAVPRNATEAGTQPELPPVPVRVAPFLAWSRSENKLYVERGHLGDPMLLTWIDRMRRGGVPMMPRPVEMDEIARLRSEGYAISETTNLTDLRNRERALWLLRQSARVRASDMHLLIRDGYAEIQVRIKGDLKVLRKRLTVAEGESVSRALFQSLATVKDQSYNPMQCQNAQISGEVLSGMGLTSVRLVRGPAYPSEKGGGFVVARLQYTQVNRGAQPEGKVERLESPRVPEGNIMLAQMGYTPWQVETLTTLACAPSGIVLFTGPTGSGKTTALAEMLKHLARTRPESRQVTIEDPVEYPLEWAVQMAVTNARTEDETGDAFADHLRTALRMDPDIILLGEIRGAGSAVAALNASITGHQVWSTLHVTDPYLAVDRLELMDPVNLNRKVFCDHTILRGIVAQRLVPKLCPQCRIPLSGNERRVGERLVRAVATHGDLARVHLRGAGCDLCQGDGIDGRMAVAEVVATSPALMKDLVDLGTEAARNRHRARPNTDKSLLGNALAHVFQGRVDPRDVERVVDVIGPKEGP